MPGPMGRRNRGPAQKVENSGQVLKRLFGIIFKKYKFQMIIVFVCILWAIIYRYLWCVRRNATINPTYVRAHLCKETKCEAVINTQRSELSH